MFDSSMETGSGTARPPVVGGVTLMKRA